MKTDASDEFIYRMRCEWEKKFKDKDFKGTVDFSDDKELNKKFKRSCGRFFKNPEKYWGTKSTAVLKIEKKKNKKEVNYHIEGIKNKKLKKE